MAISLPPTKLAIVRFSGADWNSTKVIGGGKYAGCLIWIKHNRKLDCACPAFVLQDSSTRNSALV